VTALASIPMTHEALVVEPVIFPAGIADLDGRTAYVADQGEIVAIDLTAGQVLWRTPEASVPLVALAGRVAAGKPLEDRPNALRIVVLDVARQGAATLVSLPVVFPEWVSVESGGSFRLRPRVEGSLLILEWAAQRRYVGGASPPPHLRQQASPESTGVAVVDLETGRLSVPSASAAFARVTPPGVRTPPLGCEDLDEPWLLDGGIARAVWEVSGADQVLCIEVREPSSDDLHSVEVARGRGLVARITADGRYLLVRPEQGPSWSVVAVATGRRQWTLTGDLELRAPAVIGARAFYLLERHLESTNTRTIRAHDLPTDALAWELPLRDVRASRAPRPRQ
jgi:hypothetical protein